MTLAQKTLYGDCRLELPVVSPSLPGHGSPGPDCGKTITMLCNSCGHSWLGVSKCLRRTCPTCWRAWAFKESRRAGLRMWAGSIAVTGRRRGFRIVHAVVSMADNGDDLQNYRVLARATAKKHGLSGGLMIWHPYRQDDDAAFVQDGHVHFHIIGLARGNIKPGESAETLFKVIRHPIKNDFNGFRRCREIKACIFYLLTHCGIIQGRHTLTWYGEMSYNSLSNSRLEEYFPNIFKDLKKEIKLCPSCKSSDIGVLYKDWMTGEEYLFRYEYDNDHG